MFRLFFGIPVMAASLSWALFWILLSAIVEKTFDPHGSRDSGVI